MIKLLPGSIVSSLCLLILFTSLPPVFLTDLVGKEGTLTAEEVGQSMLACSHAAAYPLVSRRSMIDKSI